MVSNVRVIVIAHTKFSKKQKKKIKIMQQSEHF